MPRTTPSPTLPSEASAISEMNAHVRASERALARSHKLLADTAAMVEQRSKRDMSHV